MPKYDGDRLYRERCTKYEEEFAKCKAKGLSNHQSYIEAYINVDCSKLDSGVIDNRASRIARKPKVKKRIEELIKLNEFEEENVKKNTLVKMDNGADNQTPRTPFEIFKDNPKEFVIYETYQFLLDCKLSEDRPNRLKAIETLAKLFNLYGENQNITNNQLNQIIINSKDINSAVDAIHQLVNKQS